MEVSAVKREVRGLEVYEWEEDILGWVSRGLRNETKVGVSKVGKDGIAAVCSGRKE